MAHRLSIAESQGIKRAYSFLVDEAVPLGYFTAKETPEEVNTLLEELGQSDSVPPFLFEPAGELVYIVTEA